MKKKKLTQLTLTLGDFKKLLKILPPNVRIKVYIEEEVEIDPNMKPKKKVTLTINDIAIMITDLKNDNNRRFDKIDARFEKIEKELADTRNEITARLDYIVKANNLKDKKD